MNFEDFENKFRESDPARSLSPSEAHHHDHMIERAMSADTTHLPPVSRWTTRRKVTSSAAAALLLGGLMAPTLTGSMVAGGPERLVFTGASANVGLGAPEASGNRATADKMGSSAAIWGWGNTTYVVEGSFSDSAGAGAGYEVVAPADAAALLQKIASSLGIGALKYEDQGKSWSFGASDYTGPQFYGNDGSYGDGGNFSYYNPSIDPWSLCYGSKGSVSSNGGVVDPTTPPEQCVPTPAVNLPTATEAKALAKQWLTKWGEETANLRFETYGGGADNLYGISVTAIRTLDGYDTPFSWYFNFVDNGALQSASGAIGELKPLGVYDLIAPNAVVARLEAMNAAQKAAWEAQNNNTGTATTGAAEVTSAPAPVATASSQPGSTGTGSGSTGTASDTPIEPMPGPTTFDVVVHVTRIERTMVTAYLADNRMVWLPGYSVWGWTEGDDTKTVYQMNSVVGIVDTQIDVNSLFSWGPVMAMDTVFAVR